MPEPKDVNKFRDLSPADIRALFMSELRTVTVRLDDLEWRDSGSGDGSRILTGYAAVYDQLTTLYDGTWYTLNEIIKQGAFDRVLSARPDVHLNIGHDMNRVIARTKKSGMGALELTSDAHGLRVYARLNPEDPDVISLASKMDLGIMDQMSFAFRIKANGYSTVTETDAVGHETDTDTLDEIYELFDVCVCAQGAYPQTEASLRTLLTSINLERRGEPVAQEPEVREESVSRKAGGAADELVERQLELAYYVRATQARRNFSLKEAK